MGEKLVNDNICKRIVFNSHKSIWFGKGVEKFNKFNSSV